MHAQLADDAVVRVQARTVREEHRAARLLGRRVQREEAHAARLEGDRVADDEVGEHLVRPALLARGIGTALRVRGGAGSE